MRRLFVVMLSMLLLSTLAACHESGDDATVVGDTSCKATDVKGKEGQVIDLACVKVTVTNAEFVASQLKIDVLVENKSDKQLTLKSSYFTSMDSTNTNGLPTTCGGTGGFSGELKPGEKIESKICWYLVGGDPPLVVNFAVPGSGNAIIELNIKE